MPHRRRNHHSLSDRIPAALTQQIDEAISLLKPSQDVGVSVHEARKRLKKLRAIWRLVQAQAGVHDKVDRTLRRAAHRLASLRDADARRDALELLGRRFPGLITDQVMQTVDGRLTQAWVRASHQMRRSVADVRRDLKKLQTTMRRRARQAHPRRATNRLCKDYRKARDAAWSLSWDGQAADFHAWRRQVKRHTYQLGLFRGAAIRHRIERLKTLEGWLGDAHDLHLLRMALVAGRRIVTPDHATALVLGASVVLERSLRRRVLTLGQRLFARPLPAGICLRPDHS